MRATNLIGYILLVVWWALALFYHNQVVNSYLSSNLATTFLALSAILFSAVYVMMSLVLSISHQKNGGLEILNLERGMRTLRSIPLMLAVSMMANLTSYFVSGDILSIMIYIQIVLTPASVLGFSNVFKFQLRSDQSS